MYSLGEVQKKLADHNLSKVARRTKLNYGVVRRIVKGKPHYVSVEAIKALSEYIDKGER